MMMRKDAWNAPGAMSEAETLKAEEAKEAELRRLEEEAMAKRWAEKERALKDAMLLEEERRLAEERRRLDEERKR